MTDKIVVLCNCGGEEEARRVARHLVAAGIAACVNVMPRTFSIYRWKGNIEETDEWTLLIKSTRKLFDTIHAEIRKVHSYEVPEVIAFAVVAGNEDYLKWIDQETGS